VCVVYCVWATDADAKPTLREHCRGWFDVFGRRRCARNAVGGDRRGTGRKTRRHVLHHVARTRSATSTGRSGRRHSTPPTLPFRERSSPRRRPVQRPRLTIAAGRRRGFFHTAGTKNGGFCGRIGRSVAATVRCVYAEDSSSASDARDGRRKGHTRGGAYRDRITGTAVAVNKKMSARTAVQGHAARYTYVYALWYLEALFRFSRVFAYDVFRSFINQLDFW